MFLTTPSDRHPIKSAIAGHGCDVWTHITLTVDFPWYCLSYSSRTGSDIGVKGTELLSKPNQVVEFLSQSESNIHVEQLLLVSPPRLNRTRNWQMEPLAEVWRGHFKDSGLFVHVYVLQDGRRYVGAPNADAWQELLDLTPLFQFSQPTVY